MPVDIKSMVYINPLSLAITGIRTKKICCQDILSSKGVKIEALVPPYQPPKMVDLIKQGLTAVAAKDLAEELKKIEGKFEEKDYLAKIKETLEKQGIEYALQPKITSLISPPEVVLPTQVPMPVTTPPIGGGSIMPQLPVSYQPLAGGQQDIANMDLLKKMSEFNQALLSMFNDISSSISKNFLNMQKNFADIETMIKAQSKFVVDTIYTLNKAMTKELADYFYNMLMQMIKNGCAYFPIGVTGYLSLQVSNNTPLPLVAVLDNIVVKSGDYKLSNPTMFTIMAAPMERSTIKVPINVENIDAVDYIVNAKDKGVIPVQLVGKIKIGGMESDIDVFSGSVEVK